MILILCLLNLLLAQGNAGNAGNAVPCETVAAPLVVMDVGGKGFRISYCTDVVDQNGAIATIDGGMPFPLSVQVKSEAPDSKGYSYYESTSIPSPPPGLHFLVVQVRSASGGLGTASPAIGFRVGPDLCAAPFGVDSIAIYPTRWALSGRTLLRLDYQLTSTSPITEVQAKLNGDLVGEPIKGQDLRSSGGIWFPQPKSGSYKLSLFAKNSAGCTREVFSPIDLRIK